MNRVIKQLVALEIDNIFKKHDYYGSEDQIENELLILEQTGIEMKYDESVEEYYLRIYDSL